jgi:hypothetical protein
MMSLEISSLNNVNLYKSLQVSISRMITNIHGESRFTITLEKKLNNSEFEKSRYGVYIK